MPVGMVEEEGVSILVANGGYQVDLPELGPEALAPDEDSCLQYADLGGCRIVKIDLTVIVDGSVASLDHFHCAEERVANERWDNGDGVCWFMQIVVQLMDLSCSWCGTIGEMEHGHQDCVRGNQWGGREERMGSGSCVADRQGDGSVEDGRSKDRWGRSDE
jgi:hypothetical protein